MSMGAIKPELPLLPRVQDRMTFLYLEMCELSRSDSAITAEDSSGVIHIPAASISVLMLGPGTKVTHRAMELIGDMGVTVIWLGEKGVRYYASGRALTHSSTLLIRQAELVSNVRRHLEVVRKMYSMRFPDEDVSKLTLQQLRGREGARVRAAYRENAEKYHLKWDRRDYKVNDFGASDPANQALSCATAALYGMAHAVIVSLGLSPGLGFVHVGHERSFVYDLADLYKAQIAIPVAFSCAADNPPNLSSVVRVKVRDAMVNEHLLEKMVKDIYTLFSTEEETLTEPDVSVLWDVKNGGVDRLNQVTP